MLDLLKRYSASPLSLCRRALISHFSWTESEPTPLTLFISLLHRSRARRWSRPRGCGYLEWIYCAGCGRKARVKTSWLTEGTAAERLRGANRRLKKLVVQDENDSFEMVGARVIAKDISYTTGWLNYPGYLEGKQLQLAASGEPRRDCGKDRLG